jgi:hypothetical protein
MRKSEATQHGAIEAWMRYFLMTHSNCVIELKHSKGKNSIAWSDLKEHQKDGLRGARDGTFVWKFDDTGYRRSPFDLIGIADAYSFIAVRYPSLIAIISLASWDNEKKSGIRKSLTSERARIIAFDCIEI